MKDWKLIIKAAGLDISMAELEDVQPQLDSLESAFRPLTENIPLEIEPALILRCLRKESK